MIALTHDQVQIAPTRKKRQSFGHLRDHMSYAAFRVKEGLESFGIAGKSVLTTFNAVRFGIEVLPRAAIAGAALAYMAGNVSDDTMRVIGQHCMESSLSICAQPHLFERLNDRDKLLLSALLDTATDPNEREAISTIGTISARTGVDLTFMLGFAQMESSLGKLQNASTSSAQGIFQYVEATWLESFKRFAPEYDESHQEYADHIRIVDGEYVVNDPLVREEILALRNDDALLHSFVTARDMIRSNDIVLADNWNNSLPPLAVDFIDVAQRLNMGLGAQFAVDTLGDLRASLAHSISDAEQERLQTQQRAVLVEVITDAYLEHFLGATGKNRFMNLYNDTSARERYRPVAELIGHNRQPVSSNAIAANGNIFLQGNASVVEAYDIIRIRVENSLNQFDQRVAVYMDRQLQPAPATGQDMLIVNATPQTNVTVAFADTAGAPVEAMSDTITNLIASLDAEESAGIVRPRARPAHILRP